MSDSKNPSPQQQMIGWTKVPDEPPLELLRTINIDNQVLAYENGRYYNAWFEFEASEGGWFWTDDADSEPNPSHYRSLPVDPEKMVWQDITTAPRDGTVILLCGGAYHGYPFAGKWDLGPFGDTDRPWLNVINDSRLYGHVPQKWMPLPISPSTHDMGVVSHG
jgi:hypothetical protein